ncbi:MAG: tetratricopeptide repeat protein, partial [Gemmataceae bacterium]
MAVLVAVLVGGGWAVQHFLRQSYQTQLKLDATQLLFEIQTEIGNQSKKPWAAADWDRAASMVERVQGMIRSEPALESLAASATDLQFAVARAQEDQRTHQKKQEAAQAKFARFQRGLNDAMLNQMSNVGLKQQANLMTVRAVVPRALAEFGVSLDDDKLPDSSSPYLDDKQRASLVPSCYEMLLAWAGAVAQPLNQNKEEPQTQARKALAILDRAAKLGLDTKAYHMRRGSYLLVLGDQEGAKKELAISQKMEPTMASDYYLVGIEMYQSGPVLKEPMRTQVLRQAIEHLQKAVDLQPEHYWANYTLGQIYIHSSRWDAAVARLTACIQKNPNFPWPYPLRAHAHGMLGEYQLAEEDFAQAEKNLDDEEILYTVLVNRGFMYFRQAQGLEREPRKAQVARDRAVAHFRRAIDLRPKQFNAYANMAQLYQHEGKLNDAAVMLNRAIEYQPGVAALHRTRGRLHLRRRDYSSALADFQAAVQHSPTISSTLLADDHLECGRELYRLRKFPE